MGFILTSFGGRSIWYFLLPVSILVILASCATSVAFDVKHPPLVDLRNVDSITVIPFEWNWTGGYGQLADRVTSALSFGLKKGKIKFVDPDILKYVPEQNYSQYVDVYITGRITNAGSYRSTETREETYDHSTVTKLINTRTAYINIEYSYIRSVNKAVLGNFKKSETSRASFEEIISWNDRRSENFSNDPRQHNAPPQYSGSRGHNASQPRYNQRQNRRGNQRGQPGPLILSAIAKFSDTMSYEISPWTTTERRNIRGGGGNYPQIIGARHFISQHEYAEALDIYENIFEQTGSVSSGYNTAVLLQANERFNDALGILKNLNDRISESGRKSPFYIKREITKVEGFINGFTVLEGYEN